MSALQDWLARGAGFDCEYGGGLSNHLPMVLWALHRLGADEARIDSFARGYSTRLAPAPATQRWPAGDPWQARLGDRAAWPAYRSLFVDWLKAEFAGDVLAQVLPVLMQGVGAAAFHGVIRTAYAVQSAHRQELADALAYWACRWLPLGPCEAPAGTEPDPARLLPALAVPKEEHDLIFQAMTAAAQLPGFDATVARLAIDERTLTRLATLAAEVHAASGGNFVVLHLLTSAHAVRELLPFVDGPEAQRAAVADYWRAYAAAAAASGARPRPEPALRPWPDIVAHAIASDDDHVIKLVHSAQEQHRLLGGPAWQAAASAVMG